MDLEVGGQLGEFEVSKEWTGGCVGVGLVNICDCLPCVLAREATDFHLLE